MCQAYQAYFGVQIGKLKSCAAARRLKAVQLHNGNKYPSLPLAHSASMREDYNNVKILLDVFKYNTYGWEVIGDFNRVSVLMGLQGGFTKYPGYLFLWDSRDTDAHYHDQREWPEGTEFSTGKNNVKWEALDSNATPPYQIRAYEAIRQSSR